MAAVTRVLCPNPGPFTGPGTNTYVVVSSGEALVIDPGPVLAAHLAAVHAALGDATPVGVLVTHTHPDHAPAANPLGRTLDVPVYGFAPGPEFLPDVRVGDGAEVRCGAARLTAVHTPGHTADHLCFLLGEALFTGDHIMGGSTVIIEDAAAYLASLERVLDLELDVIHPGHGPRIDDPRAVVEDFIAHRRDRERQVLDAVRHGASTVGEIVAVVYAEVPEELRAAAAFQVETQLRKLADEGRVRYDRRTAESRVHLVGEAGQ